MSDAVPNRALDILQRLWHLLLPSSCLWCSLPVHYHRHQLCQHCITALPKLPYSLCHYNLLWLPNVAKGLLNPGYDQLLSVGYYQQPVQHWLQHWKFSADEVAGNLLQHLLVQTLQQYAESGCILPQAILYVPMHPARQRQRGYNQAELLARSAAQSLNIPLLHALRKTRRLPPQVGLTSKQRRRNLRGSFALTQQTLPEHVALVDDVLTTGATANEICRLLRRNGVRQISMWTIAVTLKD